MCIRERERGSTIARIPDVGTNWGDETFLTLYGGSSIWISPEYGTEEKCSPLSDSSSFSAEAKCDGRNGDSGG